MSKKFSILDLYSDFGMQLTDQDTSTFNMLHVEQRAFQAKLKDFLNPSDGSSSRRNTFLQHTKLYFDNEKNFLISLLPTKSNLESQHHSSMQDSLVKLLLETEEIQSELFDYLIQKLADYSEIGEKQNDVKLMNSTIIMNVPTYIVDQFRYQPKIVDADHLCKKVMELIQLSTKPSIKKQLILCIPDILSDCQHDNLLNELESLLDENNTDLIGATLDTLSNLKFQTNNQLKLVDSILAKYALVNEIDLPYLIKFLLKSANQLNSKDILSSLREKICLENDAQNEQTRLAIFQILKEYFNISGQLIELFLSVVSCSISENRFQKEDGEQSTASDDERHTNKKDKHLILKPIDFLIFCIVYALPQHFKNVDKLFKQILKVETVKNLEYAIESVFKTGKSIMNELFDSCINSMAKSLITNSNVEIYSMGQFLLKKSFQYLDKKHKHLLVQLLIDQITCSSSNASRDNSLDILVDLCSISDNAKSSNALAPFSLELKSLINFIEYFNLSQIRKVYFVLCSVAYSVKSQPKMLIEKLPQISMIGSQANSQSNNSSNKSRPPLHQPPQRSDLNANVIQDNLHILINKQLSSNTLKYKQIGVIGALMMLKNMSMQNRSNKDERKSNETLNETEAEEFFSCSSSQDNSLNSLPTNSTKIDDTMNMLTSEIKHVWQMIIDSSKSSPESLGLFEDNLSSLLSKSSIQSECVEFLIKNNLRQVTRDLFKLNINEETHLKSFYSDKLSSFKFGYEFGLDAQTSGALNLLSLQMNETQKTKNFTLSFLTKRGDTATGQYKFMSPLTIASTFRLFASLERNNISSLKDYIGLPVLTIKKDELYKYGNLCDKSDNGNTTLTSSLGVTGLGNNLFNKFKHYLNDEERKLICDTIFYLINWFIELINAFAPEIKPSHPNESKQSMQQTNEVSHKLLSRLTTIYELEQLLINLLPHMKFYRPPMCVFGLIDSSIDELPYVHNLIKIKEAKKPKKPAKRKPGKQAKKPSKKKKTGDESELMNNEIEPEIQEEEGEEEELEPVEEQSEREDENKENVDVGITADVDLQKLAPYFRDFDLKLINFVNLELELDEIDECDDSVQSLSSVDILNTKPKIRPHLLHYVLSDFNRKLSSIFKISSASSLSPLSALSVNSNKLNKTQLFMQLNTIEAQQLARHLIDNCIDMIIHHVDTIKNHIKTIQEKYDNLKDPNEIVNNPKNISLLKCLNQMLKLLGTFFTWLNSNNEQKMLGELFKKLDKSDSKLPETAFYNYISRLKEVILDLGTMQTLVQFMDLLCNRIILKRNAELKKYEKKFRLILIEACKEFLLNDYNIKLNAMFASKLSSNEAIKSILQTMLQNNEEQSSIDLVEKLCKTITSDDFILDRQSCDTFNTLKLHFLSYYKTLLEYTVNGLRFIEKYDYNRIEADRNLKSEIVSKIRKLSEMHSGLVTLKKHASFKEINILTVLKYSKLFLNIFLKCHMPWLDKAFDDHRQQVVEILEEVQKSVVYLQEYCLTNTQNAAVVKQTAQYVRCVEAFSFRIKQMFFVNNVDEAFSVNLFQNKLNKKKQKRERKEENGASMKAKKQQQKQRQEEHEVAEEEDEDEDEQDEVESGEESGEEDEEEAEED